MGDQLNGIDYSSIIKYAITWGGISGSIKKGDVKNNIATTLL